MCFTRSACQPSWQFESKHWKNWQGMKLSPTGAAAPCWLRFSKTCLQISQIHAHLKADVIFLSFNFTLYAAPRYSGNKWCFHALVTWQLYLSNIIYDESNVPWFTSTHLNELCILCFHILQCVELHIYEVSQHHTAYSMDLRHKGDNTILHLQS